MLNKKQTTANQCVGALLTGRGDWTVTELFLAGVQGWETVVRRLMNLRGIGQNGAWLLVYEFFSWRC